ncbi:hypothetical protein BX666DRAFT_1232184 [Dichotomocladium elegans]|nr:hypothetical protein BX666DRAFT_1232184 [Dichotomocladium elegans]
MATIARQLIDANSQEDLDRIASEQKESLVIYQKTHQQLATFNDFSKARYQDINKHFESHTTLLKDMKRDLDSVFKKLSKIKRQLEQKYPHEMSLALIKYPPPAIEEE